MNKMKHTILRAGSRASLVLFLALAAAATACEDRLVSEPGGILPDEAAIGHIGSTMRSSLSISGRGQIVLAEPVEGEEPRTVVADEIYYELSKPAATDTKVTLSVGTELTPEFLAEVDRQNERVKAYNKNIMWNYPAAQEKLFGAALLPAKNLQLESGTLTVPSGKTISEAVKLSISNIGLSKDSLYFLPLTIVAESGQGSQTFGYVISTFAAVQKLTNTFVPDQDIKLDDDFFTIFYVNTETYQPLIADIYAYARMNMMSGMFEKTCTIGNLVNLRPASVGFDVASGRALFNLSPDLRYVLGHRGKYIDPLQNRGRKVCVCIQGGGKGLGFCNLNDAQIADFTAQVKKVVYDYNLDGVNLWDEGAKYGKEGMPAVNTTSYPKLIKALREAMPDKLLTLVDKDEPTEYFHDVEACGGIEVGKYIDYAWSGYYTDNTNVQIVEPWEEDHPFGDIVRKPIAGLAPENYGSFSVPRLGGGDGANLQNVDFPERLIDWRDSGRRKNNMVVFSFDLTANEQTQWEGEPLNSFAVYMYLPAEDGGFMQEMFGMKMFMFGNYFRTPFIADARGGNGYGLYKKDWQSMI